MPLPPLKNKFSQEKIDAVSVKTKTEEGQQALKKVSPLMPLPPLKNKFSQEKIDAVSVKAKTEEGQQALNKVSPLMQLPPSKKINFLTVCLQKNKRL